MSHFYPNPANMSAGGFIHHQLRELANKGHTVTVLAPLFWRAWPWSYKKFVEFSDIQGIQVVYTWYPTFGGGVLHWLSAYTQWLSCAIISRMYLTDAYDVLYVNNIFPDGLAGISLGKRLNVPVVSIARGELVDYAQKSMIVRYMCRRVLRASKYVLTTSDALRQEAVTIAGEFDSKYEVLYNGVDKERFCVQKEECVDREAWGCAPKQLTLGFVGALDRSKGLFELAEVFCRLAQQYDLRLILVGQGKDRDHAEKVFQAKAIRDRVIFTGHLDHADINKWLNRMDVFVFPSYTEGLPNAVYEAMCAGLPIIGSRAGGIPELVQHEQNGLLVGGLLRKNSRFAFSEIDKDELERSIVRLIIDKPLRIRMGLQSLNLAATRPSWLDNARKLEQILIKVLDC